ncbi:MAG: HAD-IA family hydrolase [Planctomycetota bacterium]|nr:HAD-IA family hydrolase [Planctomycetota bacterium]MEC8652910.1 HAD-IA family hydrolase [Planctomycetota bacterium]
MSPAPAFLFDLDGTLADTLPDLAASTNYVRSLHGLPAVDAAVVRSFVGDGARALLRRALHEAALDDAALDAAFDAYVEHHAEQCTRACRLFDGVAEHLHDLVDRGHPIAVVTNKPERFARPVVAHLGLDAFTDVVVGGDTLPTRKPDPAMLSHALARLGAPSGGATMVGDSLQDLVAGKALGARTVACLFGYSAPDALRAEGADEYWSAFGVRA